MPVTIELSLFDWVVCIVALGGSIFIGLWLSLRARSTENSAGFFLAGRSLTWPVVGASLFATNIGAEHLVGLSGDSYRYGLCAGTVELATAICLGFAAAVLLPHYLRNKIYTIPEFLETRYSPRARVAFSGLMILICIMTKTAFTLYAGALVLHLLIPGWDIMPTIVVLGGLAAVITMVGGFTTVAYTDTIQTVIMLVGSGTMTIIGLNAVGGWHALTVKAAALPAAMHLAPNAAMHIARPLTDPNYPFWGIIIGAIYGGIFYWGMDQVNAQRMLGAKNLNHARWGAMFATLLKLFPVFIFALPGVIALVLSKGSLLVPDAHGHEHTRETFAWLLTHLLPSGMRGLLLSSLLAALISSLLAIMNSMSTMAVRDFVLRFRPDTSEQRQVWLARAAIVGGAFLGVLAAYPIYKSPDGIYKYLQTISIYLAMPVTPVIAFGIMSKRVTIKGATWSVIAGAAVAVIYVIDQLKGVAWGTKALPFLHFEFHGIKLTENYTLRGLWGTLIVIAVLFIVSAFTKKTDKEVLDHTTVNWRQKREPFTGITDWRLHWVLLAVATVLLYKFVW